MDKHQSIIQFNMFQCEKKWLLVDDIQAINWQNFYYKMITSPKSNHCSHRKKERVELENQISLRKPCKLPPRFAGNLIFHTRYGNFHGTPSPIHFKILHSSPASLLSMSTGVSRIFAELFKMKYSHVSLWPFSAKIFHPSF